MRILPFLLLCCCLSPTLSAQDFLLQGWYWDYDKDGCNGYVGPSWARRLTTDVAALENAGFTYVWLPPLARASFGACSNGYDPQDLYDLGEYGGGPTGAGTRAEVDTLIAHLRRAGIGPVADVVYNHRDGGLAEDNPAVKAYVEDHFNGGGKAPFPSDRYRLRLPLGGTYGAGDYYIKISSKTQSYGANEYKLYATVDSRNNPYQGSVTETEPNGGGDCGQPFNDLLLDQDMVATLFDFSSCYTDEFKLTLTAQDFDAAGDDLLLFLNNTAGGYSDHRPYAIYYAPASAPQNGFNIDLNDLRYETYTDFTQLPSGRGGMNFENFRPNSDNAATTFMSGDFDAPLFFYDVVQTEESTATVYADWNEWLFDSVGITGLRMDAVKHFPPAFVAQMLDSLHADGYDPGMIVGEFFDGNAGLLKDWVDAVNANVTQSTSLVRVFDFSLRNALKEACDNGFYDRRNVFTASLYDNGLSGFNVVTFANNHDFRGPGEAIQNDALLAYAYLLTNNQLGVPSVFYPDYFGTTIPDAPTQDLSAEIDQLMAIHRDHIVGSPTLDYLNRFGTPYAADYQRGQAQDALIYQISDGAGGAKVVVAINFGGGTLKVNQEIRGSSNPDVTVGSAFADLTGNAFVPSATLTAGNRLLLDVPARSYAVYVAAQSLPVTYADFTATRGEKDEVLLAWTTSAEDGTVDFVPEVRNIAGDFTPLAAVPATGAGSYAYVDDRPWAGTERYYRIRSRDGDGMEQLSAVRRVENKGLRVWPNPARGAFRVAGASGPVNRYAADGRLVKTLEGTGETVTMGVEELAPGVYFVRAGERVQRLIVR